MRIGDVFRLVSIGADFQQIEGQDSAAIFDEAGAQIRTDLGRGKQRFLGVFGQVDVFPTDRLELLASARLQNFSNFDGFDGTGGLGQVPASSSNSLDPRLSARYVVTDNVALRAAAYTAFRAPNLDNLYRAFSVPSGIFEPNAQLKPERLKGAEAGFDVNWGTISGQFTAYTAEITDLITSRPLDPAELPAGFVFGTRNVNAGKVKADGVEATLDWSMTETWNASFGYAYMNSRIADNRFDPASVGKQQAGVPLQQASAGLSYVDPRGWRASLRLRWVDKSWGDNDNTLPIGSHFVADAAVAYAFASGFEAFLNIENLFDRRYVADNSGFNPPLFGTPFTAFAGLRVRFN
jgi:outer membrane receptor protein involved in Fe transport